jgi:serine phosphatase RsbU (regulator of sigma subunit)
MSEQSDFRTEYAEAFRTYLRAPDESALQGAYLLGRRAVQVGLSVLELADAHHEVLTAELGSATVERQPAELAGSARAFLNETLSTFDMASRGFREASETVRLEKRHSARLRLLAEAFLELNGSLRPLQILELVTARARTIHDVESVRARITLSAAGAIDDQPEDPADDLVVDVIDGATLPVDEELAHQALATERPVRGQSRSGSVLIVPLLRTGAPATGVIQLSGPATGTFTDQDEAILVQFASMTAIAVENALRFQHEHQIAATLQRSLLPQNVAVADGVDVAVRYRAGGEGVDIGGDFYDVVELGGRRLALALGDVMGKGIRAAATMGQLRMALRAYATDGRPPAAVVSGLDRLMASLRGDAFATMAYLDLSLERGTGRLTLAGHPPPVLRTPDGEVRLLEGPVSPPLGLIGDEAPAEIPVDVPDGSLLLLYSDGLIEGRDLPVADGLERLLAAVRSAPVGAEAVCDHVLDTIGGLAGHDDTAMLALRVVCGNPGSGA